MPPTDLEAANKYELRKLVLSIEAQPQQLGLLLAVCDDRNLQARLIDYYEAELADAGLVTRQVRLSHKRPSLKAALTALVEREPALQTGDPAVVTVLNAGELLGVRLTEEKSEQEKFFFSLQWTREALLRFNFPIVLWLPDDVATRLAQRAPDFWSWRSGVFEFAAAPPDFTAAAPPDDLPSRLKSEVAEPTNTDSQIPIADLEQQIATLTETSPESPLLITLHNTLGDTYQREYRYQQALAQYQQALTCAEAHQDKAGQAYSLHNLGDALTGYGRPAQAIPYYQQALTLYRALQDQTGEALTLIRSGFAHYSIGQYQQAIDFHQQSLEIAREIGNRGGEATSLRNLGLIHDRLGKYQQAIDFHQQSLEIDRETSNRRGEAASLRNLGSAYYWLGKYPQAIDLSQQSLKIAREIGDREGEAASLGNIGLALHMLGQHRQAINFHQQSLEIKREIGDRRGEGISLCNLGIDYDALGQYQQAIDFYKQSVNTTREIDDQHGEADALFWKARTLAKIDDKWQARECYQAAREIYSELGLPKKVENCDAVIRDLGQQIVMEPKQAPAVDELPSAKPRRQKIPSWVWVVVGLALALLISWLLF
ncbi:MAG: tetratricopeptide repeat protein [Leptolyngbyaceae cyanobacterium]